MPWDLDYLKDNLTATSAAAVSARPGAAAVMDGRRAAGQRLWSRERELGPSGVC
jgi:hypothetical protein